MRPRPTSAAKSAPTGAGRERGGVGVPYGVMLTAVTVSDGVSVRGPVRRPVGDRAVHEQSPLSQVSFTAVPFAGTVVFPSPDWVAFASVPDDAAPGRKSWTPWPVRSGT